MNLLKNMMPKSEQSTIAKADELSAAATSWDLNLSKKYIPTVSAPSIRRNIIQEIKILLIWIVNDTLMNSQLIS